MEYWKNDKKIFKYIDLQGDWTDNLMVKESNAVYEIC